MPILWRYLLRSYFQIFLLSVSGFISVLLVIRFQEIARFAALGADKLDIGLFTLLQIPYILPIAIPISCLIASLILFQKLSHSQELTAVRASGVSLKKIALPLILAGYVLTLLNFSFASEISPRCKIVSRKLVFEMLEKNPLFLFQRDPLIKIEDTYLDLKTLSTGKEAKELFFAINNHANKRLGLLISNRFWLERNFLKGSQVSFISSVDPKKEGSFDHLVIENQETMTTEASFLSQQLEHPFWKLHHDYLSTRMLLTKASLKLKENRTTAKIQPEIARRFSLGAAAFTFTLIGVAFGMEIGRTRSRRGLSIAISLALLFLLSFLTAKSMKYTVFGPCLCYLLPHPIIILLCIFQLKRRTGGLA